MGWKWGINKFAMCRNIAWVEVRCFYAVIVNILYHFKLSHAFSSQNHKIKLKNHFLAELRDKTRVPPVLLALITAGSRVLFWLPRSTSGPPREPSTYDWWIYECYDISSIWLLSMLLYKLREILFFDMFFRLLIGVMYYFTSYGVKGLLADWNPACCKVIYFFR